MPEERTLHEDLTAGFEGADTSAPEVAGDISSDTPAPTSSVSGDPNPLEVPKHWSEADRTLFGSAPRPIQERWLSREKEIEHGFNQRGQELTKLKRDAENWGEIFSPLDRELALHGLGRQQYVKQLVEWNNYLRQDPPAALRAMAQQFGVDLKTLNDSTAQADPALDGIRKEVSSLKQTFAERQQQEQQAQLRANHDRVNSFADAKGEDGKPLRPYFDEVAPDVLRLLRAGEGDLERAYTKALRMNDDVWAKVQAEKGKADAAAQDRQRQSQVDKAKRAAVGSESGAVGATKPKTLRDELAAGFAGWGGN